MACLLVPAAAAPPLLPTPIASSLPALLPTPPPSCRITTSLAAPALRPAAFPSYIPPARRRLASPAPPRRRLASPAPPRRSSPKCTTPALHCITSFSASPAQPALASSPSSPAALDPSPKIPAPPAPPAPSPAPDTPPVPRYVAPALRRRHYSPTPPAPAALDPAPAVPSPPDPSPAPAASTETARAILALPSSLERTEGVEVSSSDSPDSPVQPAPLPIAQPLPLLASSSESPALPDPSPAPTASKKPACAILVLPSSLERTEGFKVLSGEDSCARTALPLSGNWVEGSLVGSAFACLPTSSTSGGNHGKNDSGSDSKTDFYAGPRFLNAAPPPTALPYPCAALLAAVFACSSKVGTMSCQLICHLGGSAMWTCLIAHLCCEGGLDDAYRMLAKMMASGSSPKVITYTPLLKGFLRAGMHNLASVLLGSMVSAGCSPDIVMYNVLLDCMAKARRYDDALDIYMHVHGSQIKLDAFTLSSLVQVLQLSSYERPLPRIPRLIWCSDVSYDLVVCNSVLRALCKSGFPTDAIQFYSDMIEKNIRPDSYTYVSLLHSLCQLERVNHAINFYRSTAMRDPESNSYVHASILCILVRQGWNLMALRILRKVVLLSQSSYKFVLEDNTTTTVESDDSDSSSDLLACSAS